MLDDVIVLGEGGGYSGGALLSAPFERWRWIGETGGGDGGLGNEAKVGEEESLEIGRSFGYWKIGNRAWLYL